MNPAVDPRPKAQREQDMTNPNQTQPAPKDLDDASLDLVVGAGVMVPDVAGDTSAARKQEQDDKLSAGGKS